jgi:tetratricopeptide (TPR) repeat protein
MDTARKLLAVLVLSSGAALAERPPLQSDFDRCTNAAQSNGRDTNLQGRLRLQMLIRANGRPYAAFVWSEAGITDRQLERCLSSIPMLWDLSPSTLDYVWPYGPISFVPGGERIAGGAGFGSTTEQSTPSAMMPSLNEPPGWEPLNVAAAQATLDIIENATAAERAYAELAVHRYPAAIAAFRDALGKNAADKMALRGLAQALAESAGTNTGPRATEDLKDASATATRLLELDPNGEQGHEAMLRVCVAVKDDACVFTHFNLANKAKDLSLRWLILRDELKPMAEQAAARLRERGKAQANAAPTAGAPAGAAQKDTPQDPCAAEKGEEQQALCVVKRCLDEGTVLYARELGEQNHVEYQLGDWRAKTVSPGKLLVTRPISPKDREKGGAQHDALWLVSVGDQLVMHPSNVEAKQISLQHNRCTARASR